MLAGVGRRGHELGLHLFWGEVSPPLWATICLVRSMNENCATNFQHFSYILCSTTLNLANVYDLTCVDFFWPSPFRQRNFCGKVGTLPLPPVATPPLPRNHGSAIAFSNPIFTDLDFPPGHEHTFSLRFLHTTSQWPVSKMFWNSPVSRVCAPTFLTEIPRACF